MQGLLTNNMTTLFNGKMSIYSNQRLKVDIGIEACYQANEIC